MLLGIGPVPTSKKVKEKLLSTLPPLSSGLIVELGAGWGTLAVALAKKFPEKKVVAYELSPLPYCVLKMRQWGKRHPNLTVLRRDFFKESFQEVSLAVCYLYPAAMERLHVQFSSQLKPGAFVLSHTFALRQKVPILKDYSTDLYATPVFLYRF